MNRTHVKEVALRHRQQLEDATSTAGGRESPTPRELRHTQFASLWKQLDDECRAYVEAYNEALGAKKLEYNNHEHGINVWATSESRRSMRLHCNPRLDTIEQARIDIERHSERFETAVEERAGTLVFTLNETPTEPAELITRILDRFTNALTEAECAEI